MKTIAENIKYPEFKEQYKNGNWITGHLVMMGNKFYNHSKRVVTECEFSELPESMAEAVAFYNAKMIKVNAEMIEMRKNINARNAIIAWAKNNAQSVERSNQSESEYYSVRHTDGRTYEVRVSGHCYPTGSMTNLDLGKIDTTDACCTQYCDMLGINY